ncbi:MAG: LysR family transcriptional regulator [Cyclobacteriaceae bacterium]
MNYTLNQLQVFLKVVDNGSVTKAAEELHLTQPAVSIQLRNFQDQFDIPLTEVVGRKIYVTDFGQEVASAARQILEQVSAINYKTHAYKGMLFGQLKIAVVSTGKYVMPYFLSEFITSNPNIELMMDVSNKVKVIESLQANEIDFALVSILPDNMQIEKVDLIVNKLYFIGNAQTAASAMKKPRLDLGDLPLIYREKGSGTRQTMEKFIEQKRISSKKRLELTSNEAVKQAILAGLGYSLMPLIGIRNEIQNNELKVIPVKGLPIKTSWSLIWLKGKKHSPVASSFLEFLRRNKESIIDKNFEWYSRFD